MAALSQLRPLFVTAPPALVSTPAEDVADAAFVFTNVEANTVPGADPEADHLRADALAHLNLQIRRWVNTW